MEVARKPLIVYTAQTTLSMVNLMPEMDFAALILLGNMYGMSYKSLWKPQKRVNPFTPILRLPIEVALKPLFVCTAQTRLSLVNLVPEMNSKDSI